MESKIHITVILTAITLKSTHVTKLIHSPESCPFLSSSVKRIFFWVDSPTNIVFQDHGEGKAQSPTSSSKCFSNDTRNNSFKLCKDIIKALKTTEDKRARF